MLQVSNVESILYASNGDLWVGSNKGLFRRKAGSRTFDCEKNMDIKSVVEDRKGQIWIGTWEQGLLRYNPQEELYYTVDFGYTADAKRMITATSMIGKL